MHSRGQGAFEYVLLLAGILLVAVIAVLIFRSSIFPSANAQITHNSQVFNNLTCLKTYEQDVSATVALWHFDDAPGSATAFDSANNGNTGTLKNGPAWQPPSACRYGTCLQFNGANQFVQVGGATPPASLQLAGPLTLSFWFNPQATTGNDAGLVGSMGTGVNSAGYQCTYHLDRHVWCYVGGSQLRSNAVPTQSAWHHAGLTWDGTANAGGMKLYIDGVLDKSTAGPAAALSYSSPFNIGQSTTYFNGFIDDVAVYSRALAPNEVLADYQCNG